MRARSRNLCGIKKGGKEEDEKREKEKSGEKRF